MALYLLNVKGMILQRFVFALAFLSLGHSTWASTHPRCEVVHSSAFSFLSSGFTVTAYKSRSLMNKYGTGNGVLQTERQMEDPYTPDYIGFLWTPADVDTTNRAILLSGGIKETHRNYGNRLSETEKQIVEESDWSYFFSSLNSEKLGYVAVQKRKETIGFLRVYDASQSPSPAEVILEKKQIHTQVFQEYRRQGFQIYELGKYFLETELRPAERKIARNELFLWLIEKYLRDDRSMSKTIFIIDVSSRAHARAYEAMFGAKPLEPDNFNPPLSNVDFVMTVSAQTLKEHLLNLIRDT